MIPLSNIMTFSWRNLHVFIILAWNAPVHYLVFRFLLNTNVRSTSFQLTKISALHLTRQNEMKRQKERMSLNGTLNWKRKSIRKDNNERSFRLWLLLDVNTTDPRLSKETSKSATRKKLVGNHLPLMMLMYNSGTWRVGPTPHRLLQLPLSVRF